MAFISLIMVELVMGRKNVERKTVKLSSKVLQGHLPFPAATDGRFSYQRTSISVCSLHSLNLTPQALMAEMS